MILDAEPDLEVVGEAVDGADAIRQAALRPDVVLMDVRMPRMDGIEATRRITAGAPTPVLVLTTFDMDEYVYGAVRAGASGFLLKDVRPTTSGTQCAPSPPATPGGARGHPTAAGGVRASSVSGPDRGAAWRR